jgi:hypothetical protein
MHKSAQIARNITHFLWHNAEMLLCAHGFIFWEISRWTNLYNLQRMRGIKRPRPDDEDDDVET